MAVTESPFEARELVGLLADDDRRRAFAALVLGASTLDAVKADTGLETRAVARAVQRLVDAGLDDEPENVARVLRAFVRDGKLTSIPSVHSKRLVILDLLAQRFEPGRHYPERTVNTILADVHPDTAALRRYMVDDGLLERERGEYWRSGGTFDPEERA
jgi:hypothetical protein